MARGEATVIRFVRIVALTGLLVAAAPAATTAAAQAGPNHKISHSTSTNWSGYAVTGHGPYTSVAATWIQPAVDCTTTPTGYSSFWVGLDGDTTSTVEQTGTEADCSSGTARYYGWYEMYPKFPVNYSDVLRPGDTLHASVTALAGGAFSLVLSDQTRGWTHTVSPRLKRAALGSAEVIAEAPSSSGGVLPLADFGTASFGGATVNGAVLSSATPGIDPITMVTSSGTVKAQPGSLSQGGFSDTWRHQ
jgi:hypothetical protein